MLEERASNFLFRKTFRKIDPEDLGAQGSRDPPNLYCSTLMFWLLMIEP